MASTCGEMEELTDFLGEHYPDLYSYSEDKLADIFDELEKQGIEIPFPFNFEGTEELWGYLSCIQAEEEHEDEPPVKRPKGFSYQRNYYQSNLESFLPSLLQPYQL